MTNLSFVNAGFQEMPFANMGIYIKYGNYGKFQLVSESTYHTHVICPDRELLLSNNTLKVAGNPLVNDYDEYLDLNLLGKNYERDFLHQYMINYTDYASDPKSAINRDKKSGSTIFCDSGGFQIAMGRISLINPIDLAKFYNENVNLGMVLDIPEYDEGDPFTDELVMDLAFIQKRNTDYMLKYLNDSVELINIIHGGTIEQKLKYLHYVHDDRIHRLALPSVKIPMSLPRLNLILEVCRQAKALGSYKHIHLLGSFNKGVLFVLAKLAHCKIPEVEGLDFTTDASSALQNSVNLVYAKNINIWEGFDEFSPLPKEKYQQIDHHRGKYEGNVGTFNEYALLPCNCPVCSKIKYSYILRNIRAGYLRNLIFLNHNAPEFCRYVSLVDKFAENLTTSEYIQYVKRVQDDDGTDTVNCLRFIKRIEEVGLDKARKEFGSLIEDSAKVRTYRENFLTMAKKESNSSKNKFEEHIKGLIEQYKTIDFETYTDKVKVGKAFRSSTNLSGK